MKLTKKHLVKVFKKIGKEVKTVKKFSDGHINDIFEVNKKYIIKILTESWKPGKDKYLYELIKKKTDVIVPEIYKVDSSKRIIPFNYTIMSKIEGTQIDKSYSRYKNTKVYENAGEVLAKIHSIKFNESGWIVKDKVKPGFKTWKEFFWYDVNSKLKQLQKVKVVKEMSSGIKECFKHYESYLNVKKKPCLLHKDFHSSHIFTNKNKITGIIDWEWAVSGHNENDFIKGELWMFKNTKLKNAFFRGYGKYGSISKDYDKRYVLYELWHRLNMVNISYVTKNKDWMDYNLKALRKCASEYHKTV